MSNPGQPPNPTGKPGASNWPPGEPPAGDPAATMRLIPVPPPATPLPPVAAITTPPQVPGETFIGKYRVKAELGRGGMGAVYLAEQPGLGREVAIKALIQPPTGDPVGLKRFLQEAQVMARTSHPNLVQVHDLELLGTTNYIVLEYVRGRSLRQWLQAGSALPPPQVFAVMHGVLQALDYAHRRGIVHRDMKPENVLISDEGMVKVADFGIARLMDETGAGATATRTGTTVGTPQYMSPEQVASSKVDGRSDLYSAGVMLYELVTGQPPFTASAEDGPFTLMAKHVQAPPQPPSVFRPGLNLELERVVLKALAKRPVDRFQTGADFDAALSRVADQMCPGWQRSLEPGADIAGMVPGPAYPASAGSMPATPIGMAVSQPSSVVAPASIHYDPTPPAKPATRRTVGCLSILGGIAVVAATLGALLAPLH